MTDAQITTAHKTIAEFLKSRSESEMTVWEMGRADRLLTLGHTPQHAAEQIIRERRAYEMIKARAARAEVSYVEEYGLRQKLSRPLTVY